VSVRHDTAAEQIADCIEAAVDIEFRLWLASKHRCTLAWYGGAVVLGKCSGKTAPLRMLHTGTV
jgi:hypothetical protein